MVTIFKRKTTKTIDVRAEIKRRLTQKDRMLSLLEQKRQVTNLELARISYRYSARLGDLRREGHVILCDYQSPGIFRYTYKGQK